jgi:hypothetical protein
MRMVCGRVAENVATEMLIPGSLQWSPDDVSGQPINVICLHAHTNDAFSL